MRTTDLRVGRPFPVPSMPAITHVDYSARVPDGRRERHGRYYRMMKRFTRDRSSR